MKTKRILIVLACLLASVLAKAQQQQIAQQLA